MHFYSLHLTFVLLIGIRPCPSEDEGSYKNRQSFLVAESGTEEVAVTEIIAEEVAETIAEFC